MTRLQARRHADLEQSCLFVPVAEALEDPTWLVQRFLAPSHQPDDRFSEAERPAESVTGPLTVEIGLGKDDHLIHRALTHPERRCVGFEYSRKKVEKFMAKALRQGAQANLRVLRADAARVLGPLFPPGSIDEVFILFPDPWPKKRHLRKRLIQPAFTELLASRMGSGARLELRTDHPHYAQQMLEVLEAHPAFENQLGPGCLAHDPRDPEHHIPTIFERKFRQQGLPLHYLYYRRRSEGAAVVPHP